MTQPPAAPRNNITVVNLLPVALTVIAVLLLLSFFGQVAPSLLAITLALILATALNPLARYFERFMPRAAAAGVTVLLVLLGLVGMGFLAFPPIVSQLAGLSDNLPTNSTQLVATVKPWIHAHPQVAAVIGDDTLTRLGAQLNTLAGKLAGMLPSVAALIVGGVATALVTLVMVVFALGNPVPLVNGALGAVPPRHRVKATQALAQMLKQLGAWGRATMLIMLVTGTITSLGFWALGVNNWLVFGILAALGELIPTLGPIAATIPPVLFTLAENPEKALFVLIFVVAFQQFESYVLAPFLIGGAGELHPLSTTIGILLFGGVFGLTGAFLTVPFLIVIKALYQYFYLKDAPDIPDAVAMALISGKVEEQLDREKEANAETEKALQEARDAELTRQAEEGELDLQAVLEDPAPDTPTEPRPPQS
ncbi:AI-2E family transporter [Deinococcus fonticola]|uniref:AI-2E family transporter n=1 Tax=Deinococcus fonticola TaxID=2528713 RepID=UPI001074F0C5|nr:AI-2E family transporter [Deinococcus fonticola]